jgi:hypothetical protein
MLGFWCLALAVLLENSTAAASLKAVKDATKQRCALITFVITTGAASCCVLYPCCSNDSLKAIKEAAKQQECADSVA